MGSGSPPSHLLSFLSRSRRMRLCTAILIVAVALLGLTLTVYGLPDDGASIVSRPGRQSTPGTTTNTAQAAASSLFSRDNKGTAKQRTPVQQGSSSSDADEEQGKQASNSKGKDAALAGAAPAGQEGGDSPASESLFSLFKKRFSGEASAAEAEQAERQMQEEEHRKEQQQQQQQQQEKQQRAAAAAQAASTALQRGEQQHSRRQQQAAAAAGGSIDSVPSSFSSSLPSAREQEAAAEPFIAEKPLAYSQWPQLQQLLSLIATGSWSSRYLPSPGLFLPAMQRLLQEEGLQAGNAARSPAVSLPPIMLEAAELRKRQQQLDALLAAAEEEAAEEEEQERQRLLGQQRQAAAEAGQEEERSDTEVSNSVSSHRKRGTSAASASSSASSSLSAQLAFFKRLPASKQKELRQELQTRLSLLLQDGSDGGVALWAAGAVNASLATAVAASPFQLAVALKKAAGVESSLEDSLPLSAGAAGAGGGKKGGRKRRQQRKQEAQSELQAAVSSWLDVSVLDPAAPITALASTLLFSGAIPPTEIGLAKGGVAGASSNGLPLAASLALKADKAMHAVYGGISPPLLPSIPLESEGEDYSTTSTSMGSKKAAIAAARAVSGGKGSGSSSSSGDSSFSPSGADGAVSQPKKAEELFTEAAEEAAWSFWRSLPAYLRETLPLALQTEEERKEGQKEGKAGSSRRSAATIAPLLSGLPFPLPLPQLLLSYDKDSTAAAAAQGIAAAVQGASASALRLLSLQQRSWGPATSSSSSSSSSASASSSVAASEKEREKEREALLSQLDPSDRLRLAVEEALLEEYPPLRFSSLQLQLQATEGMSGGSSSTAAGMGMLLLGGSSSGASSRGGAVMRSPSSASPSSSSSSGGAAGKEKSCLSVTFNGGTAAASPAPAPFLLHGLDLDIGLAPLLVLGSTVAVETQGSSGKGSGSSSSSSSSAYPVSSAGHLSLRLAELLPNNTVLWGMWGSSEEEQAQRERLLTIDSGSTSTSSWQAPSDVFSQLRGSLSLQNLLAFHLGGWPGDAVVVTDGTEDGDDADASANVGGDNDSYGEGGAAERQQEQQQQPLLLAVISRLQETFSSPFGEAADEGGAEEKQGEQRPGLDRNAAALAHAAASLGVRIARDGGQSTRSSSSGAGRGWKEATEPAFAASAAVPAFPSQLPLGAVVLPDLLPLLFVQQQGRASASSPSSSSFPSLLQEEPLPQEVEEGLAKLLQLSRYLILPARLPSSASSSSSSSSSASSVYDPLLTKAERLFQYWGSVEALVAAAADRAGLVASARPLFQGEAGNAEASSSSSSSSSSTAAPHMLLIALQTEEEFQAESSLYAAAAAERAAASAPASGAAASFTDFCWTLQASEEEPFAPFASSSSFSSSSFAPTLPAGASAALRSLNKQLYLSVSAARLAGTHAATLAAAGTAAASSETVTSSAAEAQSLGLDAVTAGLVGLPPAALLSSLGLLPDSKQLLLSGVFYATGGQGQEATVSLQQQLQRVLLSGAIGMESSRGWSPLESLSDAAGIPANFAFAGGRLWPVREQGVASAAQRLLAAAVDAAAAAVAAPPSPPAVKAPAAAAAPPAAPVAASLGSQSKAAAPPATAAAASQPGKPAAAGAVQPPAPAVPVAMPAEALKRDEGKTAAAPAPPAAVAPPPAVAAVPAAGVGGAPGKPAVPLPAPAAAAAPPAVATPAGKPVAPVAAVPVPVQKGQLQSQSQQQSAAVNEKKTGGTANAVGKEKEKEENADDYYYDEEEEEQQQQGGKKAGDGTAQKAAAPPGPRAPLGGWDAAVQDSMGQPLNVENNPYIISVSSNAGGAGGEDGYAGLLEEGAAANAAAAAGAGGEGDAASLAASLAAGAGWADADALAPAAAAAAATAKKDGAASSSSAAGAGRKEVLNRGPGAAGRAGSSTGSAGVSGRKLLALSSSSSGSGAGRGGAAGQRMRGSSGSGKRAVVIPAGTQHSSSSSASSSAAGDAARVAASAAAPQFNREGPSSHGTGAAGAAAAAGSAAMVAPAPSLPTVPSLSSILQKASSWAELRPQLSSFLPNSAASPLSPGVWAAMEAAGSSGQGSSSRSSAAGAAVRKAALPAAEAIEKKKESLAKPAVAAPGTPVANAAAGAAGSKPGAGPAPAASSSSSSSKNGAVRLASAGSKSNSSRRRRAGSKAGAASATAGTNGAAASTLDSAPPFSPSAAVLEPGSPLFHTLYSALEKHLQASAPPSPSLSSLAFAGLQQGVLLSGAQLSLLSIKLAKEHPDLAVLLQIGDTAAEAAADGLQAAGGSRAADGGDGTSGLMDESLRAVLQKHRDMQLMYSLSNSMTSIAPLTDGRLKALLGPLQQQQTPFAAQILPAQLLSSAALTAAVKAAGIVAAASDATPSSDGEAAEAATEAAFNSIREQMVERLALHLATAQGTVLELPPLSELNGLLAVEQLARQSHSSACSSLLTCSGSMPGEDSEGESSGGSSYPSFVSLFLQDAALALGESRGLREGGPGSNTPISIVSASPYEELLEQALQLRQKKHHRDQRCSVRKLTVGKGSRGGAGAGGSRSGIAGLSSAVVSSRHWQQAQQQSLQLQVEAEQQAATALTSPHYYTVSCRRVAEAASAADAASLPVASPLSLHSLLVLGPSPGLRSRLFRQYLELPFPEVARLQQGLLKEEGSAAATAVASQVTLAPWNVFLLGQGKGKGRRAAGAPSSSPSSSLCGFKLALLPLPLPLAAYASSSTGGGGQSLDASGPLFVSPVCSGMSAALSHYSPPAPLPTAAAAAPASSAAADSAGRGGSSPSAPAPVPAAAASGPVRARPVVSFPSLGPAGNTAFSALADTLSSASGGAGGGRGSSGSTFVWPPIPAGASSAPSLSSALQDHLAALAAVELAEQLEEQGVASEAAGSGDSAAAAGAAAGSLQLRESWAALASQLIAGDTGTGESEGMFSFLEFCGPSSASGSAGVGLLSLLLSRAFPNATVFTVGADEMGLSAQLVSVLRGLLHNNILTRSPASSLTAGHAAAATGAAFAFTVQGTGSAGSSSSSSSSSPLLSVPVQGVLAGGLGSAGTGVGRSLDEAVFRRLYESPEYLRYQLLSLGGVELLRKHTSSSMSVPLWRQARTGVGSSLARMLPPWLLSSYSFNGGASGILDSGSLAFSASAVVPPGGGELKLSSAAGEALQHFLSTAVTSFLQLPSDVALSAAFTTFSDRLYPSSAVYQLPHMELQKERVDAVSQVLPLQEQGEGDEGHANSSPAFCLPELVPLFSSAAAQGLSCSGTLNPSFQPFWGQGRSRKRKDGVTAPSASPLFLASSHPRPAFRSSDVRLLQQLLVQRAGDGGSPSKDAELQVQLGPLPAAVQSPPAVDLTRPAAVPVTGQVGPAAWRLLQEARQWLEGKSGNKAASSASSAFASGARATAGKGGRDSPVGLFHPAAVWDRVGPAASQLHWHPLGRLAQAVRQWEEQEEKQGRRGSQLLAPGWGSGWLRADVTSLLRRVNHHFQSEIDGHTRKYTLRVSSNATAAAVLAQEVLRASAGAGAAAAAAAASRGPRTATTSPTSSSSYVSSQRAKELLAAGNHPNHGLSTLGQLLQFTASSAAEGGKGATSRAKQGGAAGSAGKGRGSVDSAHGSRSSSGSTPAPVASAWAVSKPAPRMLQQALYDSLLLQMLQEAAAGVAVGNGGDSETATAASKGSASALLPLPFSLTSTGGEAAAAAAGGTGAAVSGGCSALLPLPGAVSIILTRDTDGAPIPYITIHGITLISALRLGLLPAQRTRAYHQFISLPLYLDMAPWNIVFIGPKLDYIDYDTRDRTYDALVSRAYEVMEVLFNYKRTLEDFKKCGGKAGNPYNFPYVSECVGGGGGGGGGTVGAGGGPAGALPSLGLSPPGSGQCKESAFPVPCGDGRCHSNYISCLRSMSRLQRGDDARKGMRWALQEQLVSGAAAGAVREKVAAISSSATAGLSAGVGGAGRLRGQVQAAGATSAAAASDSAPFSDSDDEELEQEDQLEGADLSSIPMQGGEADRGEAAAAAEGGGRGGGRGGGGGGALAGHHLLDQGSLKELQELFSAEGFRGQAAAATAAAAERQRQKERPGGSVGVAPPGSKLEAAEKQQQKEMEEGRLQALLLVEGQMGEEEGELQEEWAEEEESEEDEAAPGLAAVRAAFLGR